LLDLDRVSASSTHEPAAWWVSRPQAPPCSAPASHAQSQCRPACPGRTRPVSLPPSPPPLSSAKAVEYNDRILSEIRSDSDPDGVPDEDGQFSAAAGFNATALSTKQAAATEKYVSFREMCFDDIS
jgi:hypothetical protein